MCSAWFGKKSAVDLEALLSPEADAFLSQATEEYNEKQEALHVRWRFGDAAEFEFDQDSGLLRLAFADGSRFEADGQILGSYAGSTWEWAWNNPDIEAAVARDSHKVKEVGDRLGIPYLQSGRFPVPHPDVVCYLCAIGLKATDAMGVYDADAGEDLAVMILMKNPRQLPATTER